MMLDDKRGSFFQEFLGAIIAPLSALYAEDIISGLVDHFCRCEAGEEADMGVIKDACSSISKLSVHNFLDNRPVLYVRDADG